MAVKVKILESIKPLSSLDKMRLRDVSGIISINEALKSDDIHTLDVTNIINIEVNNDMLPKVRQVYKQCVFITKEGLSYGTGSEVVENSIHSIVDDAREILNFGNTPGEWMTLLFKQNTSNAGNEFLSVHFVDYGVPDVE